MVFEYGLALPSPVAEVNYKARKQRGPKAALRQQPTQIRADRKGSFLFRAAAMRTPRRIGYIRVSTRDQMTDRQTDQLAAECDRLHIEHISAAAKERPVFEAALADVSAGDTFVVLDLDRAFRSSIDALLTADSFLKRDVHFRILSMPVDTSTAEGELFYTMVAAFARFERRIIQRRTREGLEAAKARGVTLGRPTRLDTETVQAAYAWMQEDDLPCRYVAALLNVSRITLQRSFRREGLT